MLTWRAIIPPDAFTEKIRPSYILVCKINNNLSTHATLLYGLQDRVKNMGKDKPLTAEQKQMNQNNVAKFAGAFLNRSDVVPIVEKSLKCETMLMAGAKSDVQVKGSVVTET